MARKLLVEIIGDSSSLERSFAKSAASADSFGGRMKSAGKVAAEAMLGLGVVATGVGVVATKMAMDFQRSMELIHTQAGVTQKGVDQMSKGILDMAHSVGTSPDQLAEGMFHLASQGLRGAAAMDALRVAAEGAKVGQADLTDITNALGGAVVSGIKGAQNLTQAMGALNAIVGAGDMHMQDLAEALPPVASVAKLVGVSLQDVGAALAVFGDNNIRGAKAGTQLASALRLMAAPSKAGAKALGEVGLSATQLGDDLRSRGLIAALSDLKQHLIDSGMTATQQFQVITAAFGRKQSTGVAILLDQLERLRLKEKAVGDGASGFGAAWEATKKTVSFQFDQMKAGLDAMMIEIGDKLLPVVNRVVSSINANWPQISQVVTQVANQIGSVMTAMAAVVQRNWNTIKTIGMATFDGLKTAVQGFASFMGSSWGQSIAIAVAALYTIVKAIGLAKDAWKAFQAAVSFSWLGAALTAVSVVIGIFAQRWISAKLNTEQFTSSARDAKNALDALRGSIDAVSQAHLNLHVAQIELAQSQLTLHEAQSQWNKDLADGNARTQQGQQDYLAYKQALDGVKQAQLDVKSSSSAMTNEDAKRRTQLEGMTNAMLAYRNDILKANEAVNSGKLSESAYSNVLIAKERLIVAATGADLKHADALQKTDPAAAAAARSAAAYGTKLIGLINQISGVSKTSADWRNMLMKLPTNLAQVGTSAKQSGDKAQTGFMAAINKIATDGPHKVGTTITAIGNLAGQARGAGRGVGVALDTGVSGGIDAGAASVASHAAAMVTSAISAAKAAAAIHSPSQKTKQEIGVPMIEGIVLGISSTAASVGTALSAAVRASVIQAVAAARQQMGTALAGLNSATGSLTGNAVSAFDAVHAGWQSPASKQLAAMQLEDQKNQLNNALTQAQNQLQTDQAAGPQAGETQAQFAARIAADQQAIADAQRQITEFQLAQDAQSQQTTHDAKVKRDKDLFEQQLAELEKEAGGAKTAAAAERIQKKIIALYKKYGITPDSLQAATDWSTAQTLFVSGMGALKTAMDNLVIATNNLKDALAAKAATNPNPPYLGPHAAGGIIKNVPGGVYRVAEAGHPEAIIPLDPARRGRAHDLMRHVSGIVGFDDGGIPKDPKTGLPILPPGQKLNPVTGVPDIPAFRGAAMYLNDGGRDKNDTPILTALIGALGPRAQAEAAMRATTTFDGMQLRQGNWRANLSAAGIVDAKMIALWKANYPNTNLTFENAVPGQQIAWQQAASRMPMGGQELGGMIMDAYNSRNQQQLVDATSHAVHFADGGIPAFATGGVMPWDGLAYLHKNETVVPARGGGGGGFHGDIHITIPIGNRTVSRTITQQELKERRLGRAPWLAGPTVG